MDRQAEQQDRLDPFGDESAERVISAISCGQNAMASIHVPIALVSKVNLETSQRIF